MKNNLAKLPRAEQWADRICVQLGESVESIIEVGRLLVKAKSDLAHGEWGRMFEDELVPFSRQTAFRLMAVAEHPQLSNVAHGQHLPPSWRTLYELTKVEPKRLTAAFKDGLITPDMPRKAVAALRPPKHKAKASRQEVVDAKTRSASSHLDQALDEIRSWMAKWSHLAVLASIFDSVTRFLEEVERNEFTNRGTEALEDDQEAGTA